MADSIEQLKIKLYDVIERQAVLQAEFNQLEQLKGELAKELGAAREAKKAETVQADRAERAERPAEISSRPRRNSLINSD